MANQKKENQKTIIANVPEELHKQYKVYSAQTGKSMGDIFTAVLTEHMASINAQSQAAE